MQTKTAKKKETITIFNFWKDNRLDGHYTLTAEDFTKQFIAWLQKKDRKWVEYYSFRGVTPIFVGDTIQNGGLNSAQNFDDKNENDALDQLGRSIVMNYLYPGKNYK